MTKSAAWMIPLFALLLAASGCQTSGGASECDGWRKLAPSSATRGFIVKNDRPFAEQVAAHNSFGARRGCWQ